MRHYNSQVSLGQNERRDTMNVVQRATYAAYLSQDVKVGTDKLGDVRVYRHISVQMHSKVADRTDWFHRSTL